MAGTASDRINIACDTTITLSGLKDRVTGAFVNGATVTYALRTAAGVLVTGGTGSLTYSGTPGLYRGVIDRAVTSLLTENQVYYLEVTVADSGGLDDFRRLPLQAKYRTLT